MATQAELPTRLSAQVISTISDYSRIDTTPSQAALGVITATKGPIDELQLIQTPSALIATFGEPTEDHYGLVGAYKIISSGVAMYLVRVAGESVSAASAAISGTRNAPVLGAVTGDSGNPQDATCTLSGESLPSGIEGSYTLSAVVNENVLTWSCDCGGVSIPVTVSGGSLTLEGTGITATVNNTTDAQSWTFSVTLSQDSSAANVVLTTKDKGTYYNNYSVSVVAGTGAGLYDIILKLDGLRKAAYSVSLNPESENYILDLDADEFTVTLAEEGVIPTVLTPTASDIEFEGGDDGLSDITSDDYIGVRNPETGEATGSKLFMQPQVVAQMYPSLGFHGKDYCNAMKAVSEEKKFITCVFDPPTELTLSNVIKWINNEGSYENDQVLEGWMCETYWPWLNDTYSGYPLVMPPSVYVTINSMASFRNVGPQLPVAGNPRGIISGVGVTTQLPAVTDRDRLVTNRINPIYDTGTEGVQIYGNETLNNDYTDLRSAHIGRMLAQIVWQINSFTKTLTFELNDALTWQQWIDGATKILQSYKDKRGLNWFGLKMGLDTTTASEIAQRQIRGQIGLQFVQDAEVFWLDYAVFASSAASIDF